MTLWHPDTCACAIEYDEAITTCLAVHNRCAKHADVAQADILATLLAHNRQKNAVFNWLVAAAPAANVSVGYNPDAPALSDPVLIQATGMTVSQTAALQAAADTKFGANVVEVI
jgi:hypothetical protein